MVVTRRSVAIGLASFAAAAPSVKAQAAYPSRPIRLVVPYAAGGPLDATARVVADGLGKRLGQNVVVENKTGASGMLGAAEVAKAEPDGHTLLFTVTDTQVNNMLLFRQPLYDAAKDFAPVTMAFRAPIILAASPDLPSTAPADLAAYFRANPGKANFGHWGVGGLGHLLGETFNRKLGLSLSAVPYRGENPAVTDLVAKQISLATASVANTMQHINTGALKAVAISGAGRTPVLPNVPTFDELGFKEPIFGIGIWLGLLAPARTPAAIVDKLAEETKAVITAPALAGRMQSLAFAPVALPPAEFRRTIEGELEIVGKLFADLAIEKQ
jgi:tripartite-type tricarboxylate transporter receptor subunit TctC